MSQRLGRLVSSAATAIRTSCSARSAFLVSFRPLSTAAGVGSDSVAGDAISVTHRDQAGRLPAKRLRQSGMIPAVLFQPGSNDKELLAVQMDQVERLVRAHGVPGLASRVLRLTFGEDAQRTERVLAKQIHLDPLTRNVSNICFIHCSESGTVKVEVPLTVRGEDSSPGVKRGGFVHILRRKIVCKCIGDSIPSELVVDVSKLDVSDKILMGNLDVPGGVTIVEKDMKTPIIKIAGKIRKE